MSLHHHHSHSHSQNHHHRSLSVASRTSTSSRARSPSPTHPQPTQTFHASLLPRSLPTPALVESVAGAAHYVGVKFEGSEVAKHGSDDLGRRQSLLAVGIKADHHRVMADLQELYCCRPTREIFERSWTHDAVFEDPLSVCKGFHEYAAQWYALPKLFSKSVTLSSRVMSSTNSPNRLVFAQTQEYTSRGFGRKKARVIESIIVVELNEEEKITKVLDQWDGKLPTWFGSHTLRKLNAKIVPWLVHVPKK